MLVVITYDISTINPEGKRRLRKMAKICSNVGIPVQDSVYECEVSADQYRMIKAEIEGVICNEADSVRFYLLGRNYQNRIVSLGKDVIQWNRENYVI